MNLQREFSLDSPPLAVPWGITGQAFAKLLEVYRIERVTAGHLRLRARLFEGT